jgi:hypothetical protein
MISVDEISRMTEKKNKLKKETYVKLYEQVSRKIRQSVEFGNKSTSFQVPGFLIGYPMFDRYKATAYIKRQLERGGFDVTVAGDHELYVTWRVKKSVERVEQPPPAEDFPTLINLKKAANKYRRHAGKS